MKAVRSPFFKKNEHSKMQRELFSRLVERAPLYIPANESLVNHSALRAASCPVSYCHFCVPRKAGSPLPCLPLSIAHTALTTVRVVEKSNVRSGKTNNNQGEG